MVIAPEVVFVVPPSMTALTVGESVAVLIDPGAARPPYAWPSVKASAWALRVARIATAPFVRIVDAETHALTFVDTVAVETTPTPVPRAIRR
jgi:hypothetical protein